MSISTLDLASDPPKVNEYRICLKHDNVTNKMHFIHCTFIFNQMASLNTRRTSMFPHWGFCLFYFMKRP